MSEIDGHEEALIEAFADVLKAEESIRVAKVELNEASLRLGRDVDLAEAAERAAWERVAALMAETGEPEIILPGAGTDYKIAWSKPPERVKVVADAVPDEFCKIERKPKLKEIGGHLKAAREAGSDFPNWGSLERGEPKLCWKAIKRKPT